MKKHLLLTLALGFAAAGVVRADEAAKPAAEAAKPAEAAAKPADAAKPAAAKAEAAKPVAKNDAPGSLKAGNELLSQDKYAEAVAYFEGIGEQVESNGKTKREPYRLLGLSTAYLALGKAKDAEAAASKAVELKGDLAAAWNNLGAAQANQGQRDKAIDTYTKGIAALQAAKADTSKLDANLKALQAAVDAAKVKAAKKAGATDAASADAKPAAEAKAADPAPAAKQ